MVPEHYEDLAGGAVLFGRDMTWLAVLGPDRVSWLQGMVSNDVGRPRPGQGCLAAHLTPQGKVVALMAVLADRETLWLLSEADPATGGREDSLRNRLDRLLIMEDATIEDRSEDVAVFSLVGGGARGVLGAVLGSEVPPAGQCEHRVIGDLRVVRTEVGYDLIVPADEAGAFLSGMEAAGAVRGDEDLRRTVWIESGVPSWGLDIDRTVTLPELGESAVDYRKGCYIGQEVVARIKYIGHVNRMLKGLRLEGDAVPDPGPVHRGEREAGRLTSAALSPALGGVIALGYLRRGAEAAGTEVEIVREGRSRKGRVVDLPFLERPV